jgi:hypothetical protein
MKPLLPIFALVFLVPGPPVEAQSWRRLQIPETGASVDAPSFFTEDLGKPEGYGFRIGREDGRADLTIQSAPNEPGVSPAVFLARKNPPSNIIYKRIAPRFFVVSSIKGDKIWYDRCNFTRRYVHCVLINYPAIEKRQWDAIVTRISYSLTGD